MIYTDLNLSKTKTLNIKLNIFLTDLISEETKMNNIDMLLLFVLRRAAATREKKEWIDDVAESCHPNEKSNKSELLE